MRLQWQNIKNMLRTYQGFEKKEKERCFHYSFGEEFSTKYQDCLTIYMVFDVNKTQQSTIRISQRLRHARESLHLKNKNMLRTFLNF